MWRGLGILKQEWQLTPKAVQIVLACLHHQSHALKIRCSAYEQQQQMPKASFGPRAQAIIGYLTGRLGTSHRDTAEVLEVLHGLRMSVGSISAMQQQVSQALAEPVAAAQQFVQQQQSQYVDETGWQQIEAGSRSGHRKTGRTCQRIMKVEKCLWTFVRVEGVEPTNNTAERSLRRAVLWRRKSFGTQSARGSEFVERILTAVQTLRQQRRDVLEYLSAVCCSVFSDEASQGLIPDSS